MSSKGSVLRCDVTGKILMKCFLSGMPDLKLGLNDKIGLEKESQLKSRPAKSLFLIYVTALHVCLKLGRIEESNEAYECQNNKGAAGRGALGPFGLLILADEELAEQTP